MENAWNNENLKKSLIDGTVVVMPTDTLYGIVGSANNKETVERIYTIRQRESSKPCIILVGNIEQISLFSVELTAVEKDVLSTYWIESYPRPTSIVLDCADENFAYLHRGTKTLAFRMPHQVELRTLLLHTGPLIAPSANLQEMPPASTVEEAQQYFGNQVDMYIDGGYKAGSASQVIRLFANGEQAIIRQ